jgi:hypothetical protein
MTDRDTRVIGYFAYLSPTDLVCTDTDACVIAGSGEAMQQYLSEMAPSSAAAGVRKTRFIEILRGLSLGAAYAFDNESYARFYPLAREAGLDVAQPDFDQERKLGNRFFTVRLRAI